MSARQESPSDFFGRNGIKFTGSGKEIATTCPKCGKDGHCFVNGLTWLWHCKRCDSRGNESAMKIALGLQYEVAKTMSDRDTLSKQQDNDFAKKLVDASGKSKVFYWNRDLLHNPSAAGAREYLLSRGISLEICERCMIGWSAQADGSTPRAVRRLLTDQPTEQTPGWIILPSFTEYREGRPVSESLAVVKLRSVPPLERAFRRLEGGKSTLFSPCGIDPSSTMLVVGGEIDALSCVAAGWTNVVSPTVGEPNWNEESSSQLEACEDIVIVYDNDDAGRKGAASLSEKLGAHRCRIGTWPSGCKDANDALCKLGQDFRIEQVVSGSKSVGGESVLKVNDLRAEYLLELRSGKPRGVASGWPDLDRLVGGIRWGEVTLVTGDTASGKSTFASHFALNMARQGHRVLFCPFELGAKRQLAKWVRQESGNAPDVLTDAEIDAALDSLDSLPLHILKRYGGIRVEAIRNTMLHCVRRLGVRVIVLDHLHFMVTEGPEERAELDAMMKMIAEIAVDAKIHVMVVAHPRQHHSSNETHRDNRIIQASDLKGSAGLKQLSDNIWSVWRPRKADRSDATEDENSGRSVVYVLKNRDDYGNEGSVAFRFGLRSARFEQQDDPSQPPGLPAIFNPESEKHVQSPRMRRVRTLKAEDKNPKHWTETEAD
jgi:KaiC/GvpD/RAD55 family RecA-like ATPase